MKDADLLIKTLQGTRNLEGKDNHLKEICKSVDNLPLAITICAFSLKNSYLSVEQFAKKLADEKSKMAELNKYKDYGLSFAAAMNSCLSNLEPETVTFLEALTAFPLAGFSDRAARIIAKCQESDSQAYLQKLIDMSLLSFRVHDQIFYFHSLIHSHAHSEAIKKPDFFNTMQRHAKFFQKKIDEFDSTHLQLDDVGEATLESFKAAIEWLHKQGSPTFYLFYKIEPLFEKMGHWKEAISFAQKRVADSKERELWTDVAGYSIAQNHFASLYGKSIGESQILEIFWLIGKIEDQQEKDYFDGLWLMETASSMPFNQTNKAIVNFKKAVIFFDKVGNDEMKAKALHKLGNSLSHLKRNKASQKKALEILKESINIYKILDSHEVEKVHTSLGRVYYNNKQFDKSRDEYSAALSSACDRKDSRSQAFVLQGIADLEQKCGNFTNAVKALSDALEIEKTLQNPRGIIRLQIMLVESLIADRNIFKAKEVLAACSNNLENHRNDEHLSGIPRRIETCRDAIRN